MLFKHARQDKLRRMIEKGQMIWQDGVIITHQQYKKRTKVGDVHVPAVAIMLHQILNSRPFNGAGRRVFGQFVDEIVKPSGSDLYLSATQGEHGRTAIL